MKKLIIIPLIFLLAFTTSAQKYNWNSSDKKEFIKECLEEKELGQFMTNAEQSELCDCSLYEIQDKVKNKKESDLIDGFDGLRIIYPCLPKGWLEKVFMEECNQDASENFCRCYLEKLKEKFTDFWEFSLLVAEGKISEEEVTNLRLPCLELE